MRRLVIELARLVDLTLDAVESVERIHHPIECQWWYKGSHREKHQHCAVCGPAIDYPCATMQAISAALTRLRTVEGTVVDHSADDATVIIERVIA